MAKKIASEICLLDATYITTQYALPLFMLCVPTHVNYITVATFVTQTEDSNSITEAIQIIQSWNENWSSKYFMCDYAEEEIRSLEHPSVLPFCFKISGAVLLQISHFIN